MFRNLSALEIAEGALLADVAVVFQVLTLYLPFGGEFFRILIFFVFAILVLRRGLYVGVMSLCVAIFLMAVLTGFQGSFTLLIEGVGGLFLGVTMKMRLRHVPLLFLGIVGGSLTIYAQYIIFQLLSGQPLDRIVTGLHMAFDFLIGLISTLSLKVGLGLWWKQSAYPVIAMLATWAFTYWWLVIYLILCLGLTPVVLIIYTATNALVRLLGYEVLPFPGGKPGRILLRIRRRVIKFGLRWGLVKRNEVKNA